MKRRIQSALISVFYKDGLEPLARRLHALGVTLYSTGGTQTAIEAMGLPCTAVESVTDYPSILGGRVKTLHPKVFGGILARRGHSEDEAQVAQYGIPHFDLVVVDLYPFEETVQAQPDNEAAIIEKIDIGGVSLIRAAAKNFADVCILASRDRYDGFLQLLEEKGGETDLEDRRALAADAFGKCADYDIQIAYYFNGGKPAEPSETVLRYGENPHQQASYHGNLDDLFDKLHGKELSYNNLVDVDAACTLLADFGYAPGMLPEGATQNSDALFAVIKHTNVCGFARRATVEEAWDAALAGDPESAFGGVLATSKTVTAAAAEKLNAIFFEILVAPDFEPEALAILGQKKNRILLRQKGWVVPASTTYKLILNGTLTQDADTLDYDKWEEAGARECTPAETADLQMGNLLAKHLKSNAIALVKNGQLIGKGCGQTSRIDALRHALEKARQFKFDLGGATLASDAFFPFDDCARMAHEAGITAIVQPGGSIRDKDTVEFCKAAGMALVMTGTRHFRH